MRRKEKQVFDKGILYDVINKAIVCRIGLVKENRPYVIPMSFGFDETHIYFHSATSGEKVDILKMNNNICVEFEQDISIIENEKPCNWGVRYLTVIIHGTAELVVDTIEKGYGIARIFEHYQGGSNHHSFTDKEMESVSVYRVTLLEITGKISGVE